MKNENVVAYTSTAVVIARKMSHQKYHFLRKRNKHQGIGFCYDEGDIPVWTFNDITQKFEPTVNNRGLAYAHRNALRYRKNIVNRGLIH